ncbi:MAG: tripartite tricarboxylate transporter TctB family protein [Candidatus Nanopelagicaceae bacterium]
MKKVSQAGKGELVFAGALFLVSLVVFWDTHRLVLPTNNTIVSPRTFPYAVATLLLVASIGVAIEVLRGRAGVPEGTNPTEPFQKADLRTMAIIIFSIGLHVFLLERTGYIISAALSFWGVAYAFGAKKIVRVGAISLLFAALVYFSFTNLLDIQLPQWVLEEWISKVGA